MNKFISKAPKADLSKERADLAALVAAAIALGTKHHTIKTLHLFHEKGDQYIDLHWGIEGMDCSPVRLKIEFL